ncbi:MAG: phosphatase PAP2 family protein [Erysipelotrichaceae bacterium]|nr:phosphatase PAP2 family protein [Erysipelotrichaceae bacterium]
MIANTAYHYDFSTYLDHLIPLVPWMVYVYWGCYLFWGINYYIALTTERKDGWVFALAHVLGELVCFGFFVLLPTQMLRPVIEGNGLAQWLLRFTYQTDAPNNLLPSIHCFASWLSWIGVRNKPYVSKPYQWVSLVFAILVCISTVTVKQHVLIDVFAGIVLAESVYYISRKTVEYAEHCQPSGILKRILAFAQLHK